MLSSDDEAIFAALSAITQSINILNKKRRKSKKRKRTCWIRKEDRPCMSIATQRAKTEIELKSFIKMDKEIFYLLLSAVRDDIFRRDSLMRSAIPVDDVLLVTLRYLVSNATFTKLNRETNISATFLSTRIPAVCQSLYENLSETYMKFPETQSEWEQIADTFATNFCFPLCIGALDGKEIPFRSAKEHKLILLVLVDAEFRFLCTDLIVCKYRVSDSETLTHSAVLMDIVENKTVNLTQNKIIGNYRHLPYVIVADEEFPFQKNLMTPYVTDETDQLKHIYNMRLRKARSVADHAFGLMMNYFEVLQSMAIYDIDKVTKIVQACCVLHNFMLENCKADYMATYNVRPPVLTNDGKFNFDQSGIGEEADKVRNEFADYFVNEGVVDWEELIDYQ